MFQVVSVLIHSCIILILILVPYANKKIRRPDLSCMSCNPQHPLKSLLFLHGWLTPACHKSKTMALRKTYPEMGTLFSVRDAVGHQQLWSSWKRKTRSLSWCKYKWKDSQVKDNNSNVHIRRIHSDKKCCFKISVAEEQAVSESVNWEPLCLLSLRPACWVCGTLIGRNEGIGSLVLPLFSSVWGLKEDPCKGKAGQFASLEKNIYQDKV